MDLILASTSPYRQSLLKRLQIPFICLPPGVTETPHQGETPRALVARLALAKAWTVARENRGALVIGSDQVATLDGEIIGKPGGHHAAKAQLRACSARKVQFHTGLAVVCARNNTEEVHVEPFAVHFRALTDAQIENYLNLERPYDCAGSFKCEGLGIALFERLEGNDPTALEGLPLISLVTILNRLKHNIL